MVQSLSRFTTPIALAIVLYIGACSPASPPGSAGEARGILTLGLLPDENAWIQQVAHGPLADAIRTKTGYEVRFVTAASYNDLVEKFSRGEIDAAYFGGYTFLLAEERSGAVPLVMRDIDVDFVSYILVRRDMRAHKLNDLVGRSFAFGSQFSTSGHIMPRHFLRERGIDPERFFSSVEYSGCWQQSECVPGIAVRCTSNRDDGDAPLAAAMYRGLRASTCTLHSAEDFGNTRFRTNSV